METHHQQHQNNRENDVKKQNEGTKHPSSPSSSSSSPSHEFSFTISLHSSSTTTTIHDKSKPPPSSLAVDLSPADDIFFHGHLLPLHLLSHFSSSPRFSTNSVDSFTLPIRESLEDEKTTKDSVSGSGSGSCNTSKREENNNNNNTNTNTNNRGLTNEDNNQSKLFKPGFSLFGLTKGRKDKEDNKEKHKRKQLLGYDVINAVKKYLRTVVLFRGRREKVGFHGEAYSRSGNLMRKNKPRVRGSRGECSAPASMRTSPTNSGLLFATTAALPPANDSTMEELQAAIQAAIAHCKNSIAKEDKLNCS